MVDASVSFAVQRLGDFLIQETVFLHGVKDEVESLKNELRWMRSFLKDAEQKQDGNEGIRNWVTEIQDIAYDTEDVIETFIFKFKGLIQTSRREMLSNSVRNCFGICTIADRYGIGREIKALKNRVLEVKRMRETYGINNIDGGVQEGSSSSAVYLRDLRITTPYADEEDVVGFEDDAQFLQGKLFQNQPGRSVISILGMGGLGKTTLARKLYNNNNTKFDLHAWVCVSQEWQPRDLLERLVKSFKKLTKDELKMLEKMRDYEMEEYLRDLLEGHKYLVVIDDVWEIDAWQSLRKALPDNQNGSRIIITTRKEAVAELSDQRTHVHKLRYLRENESWPLFCKKAFPDSGACPQDMKKLGKQMMAKCGGLPLAIIVLGGLLSRKQFHEWHVVKELIWRELKNDSSDISLLLALSYNDLSHELKSCFLYLGLFPEDSIIDVEKLTRMWVAEQFITQEGGGGLDDLEEVAENYLKELIRRSLIQVVGRNWRMVTRCRVHDLLRDLAVNKANELNLLHIYNEALNSAPLNVACRRISFHSEFESRVSFDHLRQRVRTISYNGFYSEKEMVINLVSKFGLLKVLDIKEVRFNGNAILRFGKVVVKLIHLRYLGLYNTGVYKLPKSIGNCQALRTLDFDSVNNPIVMLPTSIKKLKQLRHLSGWFDGSPLLFEELTNLQCLNRLDISRWLKQQKGNEFALNAFGKLLNLKVLSLYLGDHSSPLVSVEPLLNCRHLIELTIEGGIKKVPEEMHKFLPNLKFLDLRESRLEQDPMPALEMLPNLLVLELNGVFLVGGEKIMICTATGFPQLEFLWLINDSMKLQVEEGGMPRLRALGIGDEILKSSLPERFRSLPGRDSLNWDWGIKRHLCLALVRRVPLFNNMDERLLDAICERLKPSLYTENTYLVREGDPVDEMLFIIRGRLESATTDGGRSGFFRRCYLQEGDFCGEELLTWALDPKSGSNLPSSTQTVKALTEVEAFALIAEEMKFVAGQFRHLHGRQVQRTFRFYSKQWRTWAGCVIQAAWRRYSKRKIMELRRKEEKEAEGLVAARNNAGGGSYSLGATFLVSKFAAYALRGVHRNRISKTTRQTRNLELAKMAPGEKKKLDWNDNGRPIGAFASKFANYIGAVVRAEENVPLEVTTWQAMPKEKKQKCYDKVRDKFEYEETEDRKAYLMKDLGVKFREYRHTLRKAYRSFTSDRQRLANPPENVSTRAWSWLVTYWSSREYQALCARNRANRRRLRSLHCTGSKSFARIIHERTNDTGVVPTRKVVHFKTRTKRGGRPVNDHVAAIMAKMTQLAAPPEEDGSQPLTDDEIWAKTFPPDKSGRVMCMGSNVTPSQMFGRRRASEQQNREEVNSLRSQLASTQSRLESTEKELVQTKSTMEVYEQNQAKQREELNGLRGQLDLILGALQGRGLNLDCGMRAPSSGGSSCA